MKQRLGLANALLMPRELLVLDEPTNGLDPQGTREVRALIRSFAADGTTVFVSSHLLAEVEQLCTHVGVMSGGRLVAQGTLDEFRRARARARVQVRTPDVDAARTVLASLGIEVGRAGCGIRSRHRHRGDGRRRRTRGRSSRRSWLAGVRVRGFEVVGESLEQRFVELTGEGFDVIA